MDRSRVRGRAIPVRPCHARHRRDRRRRSRRAARSTRSRTCASRSSAFGPMPGSSLIGNGARNAASRPGRTTVRPPGLRRSEATFATTFEVATPSEHESCVRARTTARTASATARASSKLSATPAEVEVALVDPGLLDRRDDLANGRPDLPRVVAVQRVSRPHEHRARAAPERLRGRHRRMDPERARDVVRGRDDAAAVRVAADDQGNRAQGWVFELLDRGEERIQVEMRHNHAGRVEMRLAVLAIGILVLAATGCGSERAQPVAAKPRPTSAPVRNVAAVAPRPRRAACSTAAERVLSSARTSLAGFAPRGAVAYRTPGGAVLARFGRKNVNGYPTYFGVLGKRLGADCRPSWYRVQLPIRPNGAIGWVRASTIELQPVDLRIEVDVSAAVAQALPRRPSRPPGHRRGRRAGDADADRPLLRQPAPRPGGHDRAVRARRDRHFGVLAGLDRLGAGWAGRNPRHRTSHGRSVTRSRTAVSGFRTTTLARLFRIVPPGTQVIIHP